MLCVFYVEPRISRIAISSGRARYITQPSPRLKGQICTYLFIPIVNLYLSLKIVQALRAEHLEKCAVARTPSPAAS